VLLGASSADEVDGMQEEDLEEHMVVEDPIQLAQYEEGAVHRPVEDSFETLCEDRFCAWLHSKEKGKKYGRAAIFP
jgi:hypothetical protein